jgi:hypothetical protein
VSAAVLESSHGLFFGQRGPEQRRRIGKAAGIRKGDQRSVAGRLEIFEGEIGEAVLEYLVRCEHMRDRGEVPRYSQRCVLQPGPALTQSVEDFLDPDDLLLRLGTVLAQHVGDLRIIGQMVELPVDQRKCLMFDAVDILETGDENGLQNVVRLCSHGDAPYIIEECNNVRWPE